MPLATFTTVDIDADLWNKGLVDYRVTRAKEWTIDENNGGLKQIRFGRELILCRLYDKALEIKEKSKKKWMYNIWGIEKVEDNERAIRVEFQIRREVLKELGVAIDNHDCDKHQG